MSQPASAPAPAEPAPSKGSRLKLLLVIGAIFFVTCISICGGLLAWAVVSNPLPSEATLTQLPPMNKTIDDLQTAIPLLQEGAHTIVTVGNRKRHSFGPHTTGDSEFYVHADLLNDQLRWVTVECQLTVGGDNLARDMAELSALSVVQMLDPTYRDEKVEPFLKFSAGDSGSGDFSAAHVELQTDPPNGNRQSVQLLISRRATPASSGGGSTTAPTTPAPPPAAPQQ